MLAHPQFFLNLNPALGTLLRRSFGVDFHEVRAIFLQRENPAVYGGRESDNTDTITVQQQYGYLSEIVT